MANQTKTTKQPQNFMILGWRSEVGIVSDVTKVPSILFPSVYIELIILKMKVCENFPFILYYAKSDEESISFVWNNWRCPLWKR